MASEMEFFSFHNEAQRRPKTTDSARSTLNDTLGPYIGDLLLQKAAVRLSLCVRKTDTVARLGGDEFVAMLEGLSEGDREAAAAAKSVADKILKASSAIQARWA